MTEDTDVMNEPKSRIVQFISKRLSELHGTKLQREIAREAGYKNPNMIAMIKRGDVKVSLDRIPALAKALEVDPVYLFSLALEQFYSDEALILMRSMFGETVSENEKRILVTVRNATDGNDPIVTEEVEKSLTEIFEHQFV